MSFPYADRIFSGFIILCLHTMNEHINWIIVLHYHNASSLPLTAFQFQRYAGKILHSPQTIDLQRVLVLARNHMPVPILSKLHITP